MTHKKIFSFSIILLLFFGSFFYGTRFMQHYGHEDNMGSLEFGPAVLVACGKGYINTHSVYVHEFGKFLARGSQTFNCALLPKSVKPAPFTMVQSTKYYLMLATGWLWKLFGVAWDKMFYLSGILLALSVVAVYLICRLAMGLVVSSIITILFTLGIFSNSYFFTNIHDFCMAPFFLWYIYFLGKLVKEPFSLFRGLIIATLAGITLGIGLGFTINFMIYIPLFILTLFLFTSKIFSKDIFSKIVVGIVYCAVIYITAYPVFTHMVRGNNLFHNVLQGLSDQHLYSLYIQQSPLYELLSYYSDGFATMVLTNYANHIQHISSYINTGSKTYYNAGAGYIGYVIKYFPADLVIHGIGSFLNVLSLPYIYLLAKHIHHSQAAWFRIAVIMTLLGLVILRNYSLRIAIFVLLLILFLGFYPAIQYEPRHVFFLTIISLWMLGLLADFAIKLVTKPGSINKMSFNVKGTIFFFLVPTILISSVVIIATAIQKHQLIKLFARYENAKLKPIKILSTSSKNGKTTIITPDIAKGNLAIQHTRVGYFVINLDLTRCDETTVYMRPYYRPAAVCANTPQGCIGDNLNRLIKFTATGKVKVFMPAYDDEVHRFGGIEIPTNQAKCITSFAQVSHINQFPLQLTVALPENWRSRRLYQRLGRPSANSGELPNFAQTAPHNLTLNDTIWQLPLQKPKATFHTNIVSINDGYIVVNGKPKIRLDYLVLFAPRKFTAAELAKANYYFIVEGKLYHGGLTLGLIENRRWLMPTLLNVVNPGDFKLAIKITKPGVFKPSLANALNKIKVNHFIISHYGWLRISN